MVMQSRRHPSAGPVASTQGSASIDARRSAAWLLSAYSADLWVVTDTHDARRRSEIDFRHRLSDGRLLVEIPRLLATVKEYAWWVRDPRFSRIDDAVTHGQGVRNLMHVAHWLTLRDAWSFSLMTPYDIEGLIEACRYGIDAVLMAYERVQSRLQAIREAHGDERHGGLPLYSPPGHDRFQRKIASEDFVKACGLPAWSSRLPRVRWLLDKASVEYGLTARKEVAPEVPLLDNVTSQALQRWLDPVEALYVMRRHIEADAIDFKPFPGGASKVAVAKGSGTERTPIPPPRLALHLMEHSARWLTDHADAIVRAATTERGGRGGDNDPRSAPVGTLPGSRWPNLDGMPLSDTVAVRYLATACWITIAAFTGRRYEEIIELGPDCLRGDDDAGWWLNAYIEKTLQRREWIPVPHGVARAVEVMIDISRPAREVGGRDGLFQWSPMTRKHDGAVEISPRRHLDEFAAHVGVPQAKAAGSDDLETWHWTPHQFRRFFAVLYFYRYEGASLEALSHHLRHFSLEMTRRYVTQDPDLAALWTDVEWGYMGDLARSIVAGERATSGGMGEHLKKTGRRLVALFRKQLQVVSPDRVGAALMQVMQRRGLVLTPKPWVTCTCPRTSAAAARARCRTGQTLTPDMVGPSFETAGPTVCNTCPFAITDKAKQPFLDREIGHLELVAAAPARRGTLLGMLEQERLVDLRSVRARNYEGATASAAPTQGAQP